MHRVGLAAFALGSLVALSATSATGCAHAPSAQVSDQAVADSVLALEVDNHNWSDVLISVIHDGSQSRFIEVGATRSMTVAIPARLVGTNGTLQLVLHRIGGVDDFQLPRVSIRTGNTVNLSIESDLNRSSVGVW